MLAIWAFRRHGYAIAIHTQQSPQHNEHHHKPLLQAPQARHKHQLGSSGRSSFCAVSPLKTVRTVLNSKFSFSEIKKKLNEPVIRMMFIWAFLINAAVVLDRRGAV